MKRNCDNCRKEYEADSRNIKRGWGLCCSKSCAAKKREMLRPGYDPVRVERNNRLREQLNAATELLHENDDWDPGDSEYWDSKDFS
jgi:hypothetical protein